MRKFKYILAVALMVSISMIEVVSVSAFIKSTETFRSEQDILFAGPDSSCGAATGGITPVTELSGADNREKIYRYWTTVGLSPAQAAGVTGSIQHESGFSPFRQEITEPWPTGGYGIAQFTGEQRTFATAAMTTDLGALFTEYYKDTFGGATSEASGFVPAGVPVDVNDKFLLSQLNYLNGYISSLTPHTYQARVTGIQTDYGQIVPSDAKLMDYLKTLTSATDAAIAWTYLYEFPGGIKATAAERGVSAEAILDMYGGSSNESACGSIGAGGLNFEQGVQFMEYYLANRETDGRMNSFYLSPSFIDQCTAFSSYVANGFVGYYNHGDGWKVVENLLQDSNYFKSVEPSEIQPFSIFSTGTSDPGHTGVILGVGENGSIILGEANVRGRGGGVNTTFIHDPRNKRINQGVVAGLNVTEFENIEALIANEPSISFAAPVDSASVLQKIKELGF